MTSLDLLRQFPYGFDMVARRRRFNSAFQPGLWRNGVLVKRKPDGLGQDFEPRPGPGYFTRKCQRTDSFSGP